MIDNQARPFQVGDEVRWEWAGPETHDDNWVSDGHWFNASLVEQHPDEYPYGWSCTITDPGSLYAPNEMDCPVGYLVYVDERSLTLIAEGPS
jgi:hypothetical protein